jgi:hypothetical protein
MAQLARNLARMNQQLRRRRPMRVVAQPALLKHMRRMRMGVGERCFPVTIKAAALKSETAPAAQSMALRAFDSGDRRMGMERRKLRGRVFPYEDANLRAPAFPNHG